MWLLQCKVAFVWHVKVSQRTCFFKTYYNFFLLYMPNFLHACPVCSILFKRTNTKRQTPKPPKTAVVTFCHWGLLALTVLSLCLWPCQPGLVPCHKSSCETEGMVPGLSFAHLLEVCCQSCYFKIHLQRVRQKHKIKQVLKKKIET